MPQGLQDESPSPTSTDRRAGGDRRQMVRLRIGRVLDASSSSEQGVVEVHALSEGGDAVEIVVPVESAMTLLNALHRLSSDDGWFDVV